MSKLNDRVIAIASTLAEGVTIDKKTGETKPEEGLFAKTLPEGLTLEQYELAQQHNVDMVAAGGKVLGDIALPVMKAHKDVTTVNLSIPSVGKDSFDFSIDREKQYRDVKSGETITKYGVLNAEHNVQATKNKGQYGLVKRLISEQAKELLG